MSSPPITACPNGNHDLSNWSYQAKNSCVQQRHCKREGCGAVESQTRHRPSEFVYLADDDCEQVRDCVRCKQAEERRVTHTFGEWSTGCIRSRKCSRCQTVEQEAVPGAAHDFGPWKGQETRPLVSETLEGKGYTPELLIWANIYNGGHQIKAGKDGRVSP